MPCCCHGLDERDGDPSRAVEGRVRPTMALAKPPIIPLVNMQFTARGLARELMEQLSTLEHAAEPTAAGTAPAPVGAWARSGRAAHTQVCTHDRGLC
jgi:hypothetical protein